ncbi:50S ribosomal protein L15e [Candidatus Nanohalobium constans]|uniref:50S ribosomal protein L15e n=1 Tax=Candidatus Nanohalobium constans TaxID=2565781 RepID=A0A5Q0UGI9_9ARCH|nr:50S ribosomal protein L15e [Candidatus Nanohalobium constans]QGA80738.1 50S ribosomal protein L15e [Candidatus Nanohalobium constans]
MSFYKYAKEHYEQPKENLEEIYSERLQDWRREPKMVKQENPTRIPKARQLGYKAKQGFNVIRVQVDKGGTKRHRPDAGRAPSNTGQSRYSSKKSKQVIAEQRASSKYENLEVLNSYWAAEDGNRKWFEVIMVDPDHPEIENDEDINWICDKRNRAENGQTPAAKESRGLSNKGKGAEKVRPSQAANDGKTK